MRYAIYNPVNFEPALDKYEGQRVIVVCKGNPSVGLRCYKVRFADGVETFASEDELQFQEGLVQSCGPSRCSTQVESLSRCVNAVLQHRALVSDVALDLITILKPALEKHTEVQYALLQAVVAHDEDKLHGEMLYHYARHFYPIGDEPSDEEEYNYWRNKHRVSNPHHGDYWVVLSERYDGMLPVTQQGLLATLEMACDWEATSEKLGHSALCYFKHQERDDTGLTPKLYHLFEALLEALEYQRFASGKLTDIRVYSAGSIFAPAGTMGEATIKIKKLALYMFENALDAIVT